jgi:hypothetical protein
MSKLGRLLHGGDRLVSRRARSSRQGRRCPVAPAILHKVTVTDPGNATSQRDMGGVLIIALLSADDRGRRRWLPMTRAWRSGASSPPPILGQCRRAGRSHPRPLEGGHRGRTAPRARRGARLWPSPRVLRVRASSMPRSRYGCSRSAMRSCPARPLSSYVVQRSRRRARRAADPLAFRRVDLPDGARTSVSIW